MIRRRFHSHCTHVVACSRQSARSSNLPALKSSGISLASAFVKFLGPFLRGGCRSRSRTFAASSAKVKSKGASERVSSQLLTSSIFSFFTSVLVFRPRPRLLSLLRLSPRLRAPAISISSSLNKPSCNLCEAPSLNQNRATRPGSTAQHAGKPSPSFSTLFRTNASPLRGFLCCCCFNVSSTAQIIASSVLTRTVHSCTAAPPADRCRCRSMSSVDGQCGSSVCVTR